MPLLSFIRAAGAGLALGAAAALAEPLDGEPATDGVAVPVLNGGAGEEDRARMQAQRSDFPLRIALSGRDGAFIVAPRLTLLNAAGRAIASVADAGPYVMFNLPPGRYRAEIELPGGRREQRSFAVGGGAQALDWNFPGVPP